MNKFQLISKIRSLSADCLPSLLDASVCGVSASQLFGRSVAFLPSNKDYSTKGVLSFKTNLIGTEGERLLREKRVPGVEI
ncbi:hypothetical protein [Peribacillus frigoritolerans]|uniref:hypothetical protein n=1 Tax=Peribacillus frigoritolerans TaxID=450367 RepID=UPI0030186CCE